MEIRIRLHIEFDPSVHLNAYGPVIVAKLPTPTITDQCANSYVIYYNRMLDDRNNTNTYLRKNLWQIDE